MRFSVFHETRYRYSAPVRLTPHVLRMTPRTDAGRLLAQSLKITPAPRLRREVSDLWGNRVMLVEFDGQTDDFRLVSRFEIETVRPQAPVSARMPRLPWPVEPGDSLGAYLEASGIEAPVRAFAADLAAEADSAALRFLDLLNETLCRNTERQIRPEGMAHEAVLTLASRRGACRDLSLLFMAACRSLGIPARFASGYQAHAESPDEKRHLHAWPEVWLPGAGWRGYDPTHGRPVTDGHVALCAAPEQAATMPLEGGFYGDGVQSTLDYDVRISAR